MKIDISRDEVLKHLGYKRLPQKVLVDLIDSMLEALEKMIKPSMLFKKISGEPPVPLFFEGAALGYAGVVSVGSNLETKVTELFAAGEPTEAYILDVLGSLATTKAGNILWTRIKRDAASEGFNRGIRRTPGCSGIDLETQGWIFQQLGNRNIHVEISSSYMMIPRKSLSFVARFGGKMKRSFSCAGCRQFPDCEMKG